MNNQKSFDEIKEDLKKSILDFEQETVTNSLQLDSQQAVNKIVKMYEEFAREVSEDQK